MPSKRSVRVPRHWTVVSCSYRVYDISAQIRAALERLDAHYESRLDALYVQIDHLEIQLRRLRLRKYMLVQARGGTDSPPKEVRAFERPRLVCAGLLQPMDHWTLL